MTESASSSADARPGQAATPSACHCHTDLFTIAQLQEAPRLLLDRSDLALLSPFLLLSFALRLALRSPAFALPRLLLRLSLLVEWARDLHRQTQRQWGGLIKKPISVIVC